MPAQCHLVIGLKTIHAGVCRLLSLGLLRPVCQSSINISHKRRKCILHFTKRSDALIISLYPLPGRCKVKDEK